MVRRVVRVTILVGVVGDSFEWVFDFWWRMLQSSVGWLVGLQLTRYQVCRCSVKKNPLLFVGGCLCGNQGTASVGVRVGLCWRINNCKNEIVGS